MKKNPNLHIYDFMLDSDDEHADCSKIGGCLLHGKNRKKMPAKVRHEPPPAPFPCENQIEEMLLSRGDIPRVSTSSLP